MRLRVTQVEIMFLVLDDIPRLISNSITIEVTNEDGARQKRECSAEVIALPRNLEPSTVRDCHWERNQLQ
jgi:hypothetical protein